GEAVELEARRGRDEGIGGDGVGDEGVGDGVVSGRLGAGVAARAERGEEGERDGAWGGSWGGGGHGSDPGRGSGWWMTWESSVEPVPSGQVMVPTSERSAS